MNPAEYLNKSVWVRIAPSIHGVGVFAIRDIPKGTKITDHDIDLEAGDKMRAIYINYTDDLLGRIHPAIAKMIHDRFILTNGLSLWPSINQLQCYRSYMNYSNFPSVSQRMVSLRLIHEGEEVLQKWPMNTARKSSIRHHSYIYRAGRGK